MKKILLLLLFVVTTNAFSQIPDNKSLIEEMNNFYNKGKIEKLEIITSEILSGKYGLMDDELKFYALMYSSNVYSRDEYARKDSQKGYDKLFELLVFAKRTSYAIPNKEAYIKSMSDYLISYKNKHPEVKDSVKIIENKAVTEVKSEMANKTTETNTTETSATPKSTSDDKIVTLTVSGTGKTIEEARLNALRSAIEQAFGAFISSKTEILNDSLVKDEIVSVSNGNIQKYDIVSQVEVPNVGYAITLNTTLSITKLTSFAESKGVVVEFKGGMFGIKIKLQKLNEEAEIKSIKNLTSTCFDIVSNSIDFDLDVSEPKQSLNDNNTFIIDFIITTKSNNNYFNFVKYFKETLSKLSLTSLEKEEYIKLNKPVYEIKIDDNLFYFRTNNTVRYLCSFFVTSPIYVTSFKLYSNKGIVKYTYADLFGKGYGVVPCVFFSLDYRFKDRYESLPMQLYFANFIKQNEIKNKTNLLFTALENNNSLTEYFNYNIDYLVPKDMFSTFRSNKLKISKSFKLSDIESVNEFKLDKINIEEFLLNRKMYMDDEHKLETKSVKETAK